MDIQKLYTELKNIDINGNIILPKEYLKKFIMMNILLLQEKQKISQTDIFKYLNHAYSDL